MENSAERPRVLVGRVFHESNGHNPQPTARDGFLITEAADLLRSARGAGTTLGGIVDTLEAAGVELIPALSAVSPPSGRVEHAFFLEILSAWLETVASMKPDAIVLELHGAMATTETNDPDGAFLASLREACGDDVVIGVGLDLHAHVTPRMLEAADICIACKENPHADVVACGNDVARLVLEVMRGDLQPVMTLAKTRMLLPGKNATNEPPLLDMHRRAREIEASDPDVRDISLYNAFRFLDAEDIGQAAVVLTDGVSPKAGSIATDFAATFWHRREEFKDDLLSVEGVLDKVAAERPSSALPFVLADMGDRVLAGAPGDSTAILAAALAHDHPFKAAVPVTDPAAARFAREAGLGAEVTVSLGGMTTPGFAPIEVTARVSSLTDGQFIMRGPYQKGETGSMGDTAVLYVDDRVAIVVTSKPAFTHDPNAFESQGVSIAELDFVVVKSGYHFELNFNGMATAVLVATPGLAFFTRNAMPRRLSRVWPDHDVSADWLVPPLTFARRGKRPGGA